MTSEATSGITGRKVVRLLVTEHHEHEVATGIPFVYSDVFVQLDSNDSFCFSRVCKEAACLSFDEISSIGIECEPPPSEAEEIRDPIIVDRVAGRNVLGFVKSNDLTLGVGILFDSRAILTMEIGESGFSYGVWSLQEIRDPVSIGSFFREKIEKDELICPASTPTNPTNESSLTDSPPSDGR